MKVSVISEIAMLRKSLFVFTVATLSLAQTAVADLTVSFNYTHDTGFFVHDLGLLPYSRIATDMPSAGR